MNKENKGTYSKDYYEQHKEQILASQKEYKAKLKGIAYKMREPTLNFYNAEAAHYGMGLRTLIFDLLDSKALDDDAIEHILSEGRRAGIEIEVPDSLKAKMNAQR